MAHGEVQALGAVYQLQKAHDRIKIIKRFPNAHKNNMRNGHSRIQRGKQHLIQHLRGPQAAHQSPLGGGAEGAAHGAAHLAGDTYGIAVMVAHENGLHAVAVGQPPQVLDGSVPLRLLPADHGGGRDFVPLRQLRPQILGQVGHILKGGGPPVEPGVDLSGAEGRLAQSLHGLPHFLQGHGFQVGLHGFLLILQIKKPSVSYFPGNRVSIPSSPPPMDSGKGRGSNENSGCLSRKALATS